MTDGKTTLQHEGERIYCKPIERAVLRDGRLTFEARGLFCFLWDLPGGWEANSRHLAGMSPRGRTAILTILKELQNVEAIRIVPVLKNGKLAGRVWIIRAPYLWAIESPIGRVQPADVDISRRSGTPTVDDAGSKVHRLEGSSISGFSKPNTKSDSEARKKGSELMAGIKKRRKATKPIAH